MKQTFTLLITLLICNANAQDFGTAVLFDSGEAYGKYQTILLDNLKNNFDKQHPIYTEFYTWDGKADSTPETYLPFKVEGGEEKPITKALYLKTNFEIKETLKTNYTLDTLGKVVKMFVYYPMTIYPSYKVVDLPTSEVVKAFRYKTDDWKVDEQYEVKDFKKYFGSSPDKSEKNNSKTFALQMKAFKKEELKNVDAFYEKKVREFGKNLSNIANVLKSMNDKRLFKLVDFTFNEKDKLEEFYIDAKASEHVNVGDVFNVYEKTTFGDFRHFDQVSLVSIVTVKEVNDTKAKVKPFSLAKKKIGEALASENEIVFARNEELIKAANREDEPMKRVQIKSDCFMCGSYLETMLLGIATTKLLERNFDGPRKFFTDQYTNEKFIDFNMSAVQDKQEGVDYLFENTPAGLKATDVQTGRIASLNQEQGKGLMKLFGSTGPKTVNLCMDIMDKNLEVLEILKEKKGKIEKFLGYNAFGFDNISTFLIYVVKEETVGGRTLEREEEIGKCWVGKRITNTIAEIKINNGEKELYEAMQNGDKIRYRVKL